MEKSKIQFLFEKDHVSGELMQNYEAFLLLNHWRKQVMTAAEAVQEVHDALELATRESRTSGNGKFKVDPSRSVGTGSVKTERCGETAIVNTTSMENIIMLQSLLTTREEILKEALHKFNMIDLKLIDAYDVSMLMNDIGREQHDGNL